MCSGQQNKQQANLSYKHMNDKVYVEEEKSEDKEWCMDNLIIERHIDDNESRSTAPKNGNIQLGKYMNQTENGFFIPRMYADISEEISP